MNDDDPSGSWRHGEAIDPPEVRTRSCDWRWRRWRPNRSATMHSTKTAWRSWVEKQVPSRGRRRRQTPATASPGRLSTPRAALRAPHVELG